MRLLAAFLCATILFGVPVLRAPRSLAQAPDLLALLPSYADVGADVVLVAEQSRSLTEHAETFNDPEEAIRLLADWGWEANASCHYEARTPAGAAAPYLFASVTLFRDADGARAAMPYIIQDLAAVLDHQEIPAPTDIGDEARQFVAPTDGGTDLSLYVRSGALIMRVSVLLGEGDPIADPEQIAALILERRTAPPAPTPASMTPHWWDLGPLLDALPPDLPACLRRTVDERIDFPTMRQRFPGVPDAPARLTALGWQTAVHREFRCDPLPEVGLNWLDMSVHLFQDTASAAEAVPFFAEARTVGTQLAPVPAMNAININSSTAAIAGPSENGTEYTLYHSTGPLLIRVSAIAADGSPQPDVESVMTALLANARASAYNTDAPYLTVDPVTGEAVALYPDGRTVPVSSSPMQQSSLADQIECMRTPSQCSLQDGVVDWTSPAYGCDWNYATTRTGCVPAEQGDYNCRDLRALGLKDIRVIGDDWMLLDEDGDGFGCEFSVAAETAYCESLSELERTACLGDLDAYLEARDAYEQEQADEDRYDDQYDNDEALDPPPDTDYCEENICR